jgi:hypothetical protein
MINLLFLSFVVVVVWLFIKAYHAEFRLLKWTDLLMIGVALFALMLTVAVACMLVSQLHVAEFWRNTTNVVVIVLLFFPASTALYQFAWRRAAYRKSQLKLMRSR